MGNFYISQALSSRQEQQQRLREVKAFAEMCCAQGQVTTTPLVWEKGPALSDCHEASAAMQHLTASEWLCLEGTLCPAPFGRSLLCSPPSMNLGQQCAGPHCRWIFNLLEQLHVFSIYFEAIQICYASHILLCTGQNL